ncbi:MAG: hypothetical protein U9N40_05410 [Euryarchaeota archaeon]|nr:hypothetical protein [Euryarchaeota archaeon]
MSKIQTLSDIKKLFQAGFDDNEETLSRFNKYTKLQLKAYLIESNQKKIDNFNFTSGSWRKIASTDWYVLDSGQYLDSIFINASGDRVWTLYTIENAKDSDSFVERWVDNNIGLDRCWLSRGYLHHKKDKSNWEQKGIGLKYLDGLADEDEAGQFSLKAWYGNRQIEGLDKIIKEASDKLAIHSTRWKKISMGETKISMEMYSEGKITINRAEDIDETLIEISETATRYEDDLVDASKMRDDKIGAFELNFKQKIDLDSFSKTVKKGKGQMRLWLTETESEDDFKRFKGVDLHNWDRVLIDIGEEYAYITVPGKGCINAVPRIATLQGEDNAGHTSIFYDGAEIFA